MLKEIEEAVAARLAEKITEPKNVRIDEAHSDDTLSLPGIEIIVTGGAFKKVAQKYELTCSVFVIVTFQNLSSVKERRHGVYPILEAIWVCLVLQKCGLAIDALVPKRLDNVTEPEEAEEGKVVFQLQFETGFTMERMSDAEVTDLLRVGMNYYLKPGDDVADATDLVTLTT